MNVSEVIQSMSPEVREKVSAEATANGKSLEAFVEERISAELTEEQLDAIAGGAADLSINIDYNQTNGTRARGGLRIRF